MNPSIADRNRAAFLSSWNLEEYTREGFWDEEEALVADCFPRPPASVLDLGCGTGRTSRELARRGYATFPLDLSERFLTRARALGPSLPFVQMDAARLGFPGGCFDAAFFSFNGIDGLYPVAVRQRCLSEVFRVLRPGGVFLLSSHNLPGELVHRGLRGALRFLAAQRGNPVLREGYLLYESPGGNEWLFSGLRSATLRQLRAAGFLASAPSARHVHVHFVARKP